MNWGDSSIKPWEAASLWLAGVNWSKAQSLVLNGDRDIYQAYVALLQILEARNKEELNLITQGYEENAQQTVDRVTQAANLYGGSGPSILTGFLEHYQIWAEDSQQVIALSQSSFDANQLAQQKFPQSVQAFEAMREDINLLGDLFDQEVRQRSIALQERIDRSLSISVTVLVLSILLSLGFVTLMVLRITKDISLGLTLTRQLAEGRLGGLDSSVATGKDEVGHLIRSLIDMGQRLKDIVATITMISSNVTSGADQVADSANSLSQGATEQAASVEEVSATLEEISSNVEHTADNAQQTNTIAQAVVVVAKNSGAAVAETVQAMGSIAEKTNIFEEIARQTNLLALNAAIEAARAGSSGKGFAVVASEVRKLAERSAVAAGEISQLSSSSVEISQKAGDLLNQLVPDIQRTSELVSEISSAVSEQKLGIKQINETMGQLENVVQDTSTSSEELAATAEEFSSQATSLMAEISFFKLEDQESKLLLESPDSGV